MKSLEEFVYNLFDEKLPASLVYHNKNHTQQVVSSALEIAAKEKLDQNNLLILKTAALLHDTGHAISVAGHEEKSCEIAREVLPRYNYTPSQIEAVCKAIMATKIPQSPYDEVSKILCDADLSYFGTDSYFDEAEKLYQEMKNISTAKTHNEWLQQQIDFLKSHHYFTSTACKEWDNKKNEHLAALQSKMPTHNTSEKHSLLKFAQDAILIIIGIFTSGFALKGFLVPNKFFDGGISGISLLISEIYHLKLAFVVAIANLPFIILGGIILDYKFALKTALCIFLLSTCLYFVHYPVITSDKLLVSIFGGFFLGIGIGLIMRAGCSLDGIEVLALYTRRKTSFTTTEIILAINVIIFSIAALKFTIPIAMYSMLTYFTASKTVDYVVEGVEAYTGVTIISGKSEILKSKLVNELGRGITIYKGERGFLPGNFEVHNDTDIIFTVITRLELRRLKDVVYETDPAAFVFASVIKEASGGVLKRRQAHH